MHRSEAEQRTTSLMGVRMKKVRFGLALALLASLAITGSASGATKESSIFAYGYEGQNETVAALGVVRSDSSRCEASRRVALVAERDGDDKLVGTDVTSRNGGFFIQGRVPADATNLLVAVKGKRISKRLNCGRAASEVQPGGGV
ncbi:hypothetical protein HJD18_03250 [Thermoleophilia bacterium SCSIO 60948]|nr:hypothetical protein HJD18_03250 [Thermoleophilia bacterium SCSIO 60948]